MRRTAYRATASVALAPRGRARGVYHALSKWCHSVVALPPGAHPTVPELLRAGQSLHTPRPERRADLDPGRLNPA